MSGRALALGGEVHVFTTDAELADAACAWVADQSAGAIRLRGRFSIALAGGTTPLLLYRRLAISGRERIGWPAWHVYFGDERACPPDDVNSNYRAAREALLDHVDIDPRNVHRMEAEQPNLDAAASEYSQLLERELARGDQRAPVLDCVLLGLGENGHTASLFPGTQALDVTAAWATRGRADYVPFDRITLTFPAINAANAVAFLVTGESKRTALAATAAGATPAARGRPANGGLTWFLDTAAASA